jgi:hypothetical protein
MEANDLSAPRRRRSRIQRASADHARCDHQGAPPATAGARSSWHCEAVGGAETDPTSAISADAPRPDSEPGVRVVVGLGRNSSRAPRWCEGRSQKSTRRRRTGLKAFQAALRVRSILHRRDRRVCLQARVVPPSSSNDGQPFHNWVE